MCHSKYQLQTRENKCVSKFYSYLVIKVAAWLIASSQKSKALLDIVVLDKTSDIGILALKMLGLQILQYPEVPCFFGY